VAGEVIEIVMVGQVVWLTCGLHQKGKDEEFGLRDCTYPSYGDVSLPHYQVLERKRRQNQMIIIYEYVQPYKNTVTTE
jgi:hypothetical protein